MMNAERKDYLREGAPLHFIIHNNSNLPFCAPVADRRLKVAFFSFGLRLSTFDFSRGGKVHSRKVDTEDAAMQNSGRWPSREEITEFCERSHIRKLSLFGSVLREDFGPASDVDVLVEFEPGKVPGFFRLFDLEEELAGLFGGRKVDLRTPQDLSSYFRDEVLAGAEVQYARE
jgi:uncharacterized protein